jgi:hypothetical protein
MLSKMVSSISLESTQIGSGHIMEALAIVTMAPPSSLMAIVVVVCSRGCGGGGRLDVFVVAHNNFVMYPIERMRMMVMMVMGYHPSAQSTLVPWTWIATVARRAARVMTVTQKGLVLISNFINHVGRRK